MLWLIAIFTYFTAASHLAQNCARPKSQVCPLVRPLVRLSVAKLRLSTLGSGMKEEPRMCPGCQAAGRCGRGMRPSAGVEFIPCVQLNAPLH